MTKKLLILLILGFIFLPGVALAQEDSLVDTGSESLPTVKLTPDIPLYFLKNWREQLLLSVKREIGVQVDYRRQMAESRLAEAVVMMKKQRNDIAIRLLGSYKDQVNTIERNLSDSGLSAEKISEQKDKLNQSQTTYQAVLQSLSTTESATPVEQPPPPEKEIAQESSRFEFLKVLGVSTIKSSDYEPSFRTPIPLNR